MYWRHWWLSQHQVVVVMRRFVGKELHSFRLRRFRIRTSSITHIAPVSRFSLSHSTGSQSLLLCVCVWGGAPFGHQNILQIAAWWYVIVLWVFVDWGNAVIMIMMIMMKWWWRWKKAATNSVVQLVFVFHYSHQSTMVCCCCCVCSHTHTAAAAGQVGSISWNVFCRPSWSRAQSTTKLYSNSGDLWPSIPLAVR